MKHPIFFDPSEKRNSQTKRIFFILILLIIFGVITWLLSLLLHPILPLPQVFQNIITHSKFHKATIMPPPITRPSVIHRQANMFSMSGTVSSLNTKVYAFWVEWDDTSFASIEQNKEHVDTLIMEELTLSDSGIRMLYPDKFQRTQKYIEANDPDLPIHVLINNYNQSTNIWDSKLLYEILSNESKRKNLEEELKNFVVQNSIEGINIDFEELDDKTSPYYITFLQELSLVLHPLWKVLSANVPLANDTFNLPEMSQYVDLIFLMAYDEHWSSAEPGPIASQDWFIDGITTAMNEVPKEKLVVTIGNYGYDWQLWKKQSTALTFQEAHTIMRESETSLVFDTGSLNPMYSYFDDQDKEHEVWYLDAVTAFNELTSIQSLGIGNISLWRMGSEDPSFWKILKKPTIQENAKNLETFDYGYEIDYEGVGEFYKLQSEPVWGKRHFSFSWGFISDETIDNYPLPYTIARYGDIKNKKIALTFDDGPDPTFTPQILDILKQENVLGTFFIIGESAEKYPLLVKKIYDDGHALGNHSFSHPDISKIGQIRTDFELVSTERIIESITGHKTILWRPPYGEDIEPETPNQVQPLINSKKLGYITVGMKIDPNDWANPWVETIISRVLEQIQSWKWNIVLLHDAWGDRSETIQALPTIIKKLKALGYQFTGINDLLTIPREEIMPVVEGNDAIFKEINHTSFWLLTILLWWTYYVFILTLVFWVLRLIFIIVFAFLEKYHFTPRRTYDTTENISVSVIVPAFNEEKVITKTIDSLLLNNYSHFDIIIIDDGSTDNTSQVVKTTYENNPKIKLFTRKNAGKGESMNYGISHSKSEVVIIIDADTLFGTDTIRMLARHFCDPLVGAVSGNVKVWNRENMLTNFQALEYNTSQNLDRRAYDSINTITVVPGAVGAWRREVILELGWFSKDTLAEDSDMTINLLRSGYSIHHEEYAYAYTEAPSDWNSFTKQRFRWAYWLLQVTWKHIDAIFSKDTPSMLRFFIFPSFLIFQIIVPIIAPLFDLFTLSLLIINSISYVFYGSSIYLETLVHILFYSWIFLIFDFIIAYIALSFEKNENWKLIYYFIPQRFIYRFFMYYINLKSLWNALKWVAIGWNKLERSGTVTIK